MKLIVAVILLVVVAFCNAEETADEYYADHYKHQRDLKAAREKCQASLDVSDDEVKHFGLENQPEKLQCFTKCTLAEMKTFDESTGFNTDTTVDMYRLSMIAKTDDKINEIREKVVKCVKPKTDGQNACGWAFDGFVCFNKAGLTLG